MCQLSIQIDPSAFGPEVVTLATLAHRIISKSQRDGFGVASFRGQQPRSINRVLSPADYCPEPVSWPPGWIEPVESTGTLSARDTVLLMHGRTGTHGHGLESVHPHVVGTGRRTLTLVHNGIVDWKGPQADRPRHDNDSRQLALWLNRFTDPVATLLSDECRKLWGGYGALGIHTGSRVLVAVDGSASLYAWHASRGGAFGFGTTPDLARLGRAGGQTVKLANRLLVFRARDGRPLHAHPWRGFGCRSFDTLSVKSLGSGPSPRLREYGRPEPTVCKSTLPTAPEPGEPKPATTRELLGWACPEDPYNVD